VEEHCAALRPSPSYVSSSSSSIPEWQRLTLAVCARHVDSQTPEAKLRKPSSVLCTNRASAMYASAVYTQGHIVSRIFPAPEAVLHLVSAAMAKACVAIRDGTLEAIASAVSDKLRDLLGLGRNPAADH